MPNIPLLSELEDAKKKIAELEKQVKVFTLHITKSIVYLIFFAFILHFDMMNLDINTMSLLYYPMSLLIVLCHCTYVYMVTI